MVATGRDVAYGEQWEVWRPGHAAPGAGVRDAAWERLLVLNAAYLSAYRWRTEHLRAPEQYDYLARYAALFFSLTGAEDATFAALRAIRPDSILCQLLVLPLIDERPAEILIDAVSQLLRLAAGALGFRYCEWWVPAASRGARETMTGLGFERTAVLPGALVGTGGPIDLECFAVRLDVAGG